MTGAAQKSGGSATLVYDLNFELKTIYKVPVLHNFFCINITAIHPFTEMGARSWFRVPGILGTWARGNATFIQERKRIGTLNSRSCEEMTQL